ncbi:MAG: hypothetical protein QOH23_429 [Gaiellaceae bacterium]|jgi:hypothetical protein|nr:hypothetical protein [Gaiellaceae bacterium]
MQKSYGVVWREGSLSLATGMLELRPRELRFEGLADSEPASATIPYEDLAGVRVGRSSAERINGRPTVIVERRTGLPVTLTTVAQPTLLGEIVERITALQLGGEAKRRTVVVVPIRPEAHDAVLALLDVGPPFDPAALPGLDLHEVFLTFDEVVFLFDSSFGTHAIEPLLADAGLWRAAASWHDHLAGPPRIATEVYSWRRADVNPLRAAATA